MIVLHRSDTDPFADRIEEILDDLVLAYKTKTHAKSEPNINAQGAELPFIDENGSVISGKNKIDTYLRDLCSELKQQRAVTGDSCYIDPETGEVC